MSDLINADETVTYKMPLLMFCLHAGGAKIVYRIGKCASRFHFTLSLTFSYI